jgi:hypothetical protein
MTARLVNMGFAPELVKWAASFLADRRIRLRFNNITSEECLQPVGVPQGSPLVTSTIHRIHGPLTGQNGQMEQLLSGNVHRRRPHLRLRGNMG